MSAKALSSSDIQQGWIMLFDGRSLFGWRQAGGAGWSVSSGTLVAAMPARLRTNSPFADFMLRLEYLIPSTDTHTCLTVRTGTDGGKDDGYTIPLDDYDQDWPAGSIAHHVKAKPVHAVLNQWHSLIASFSGNAMNVTIDGTLVSKGMDDSASAGFVVMQSLQGANVALRNVELKPLYNLPLFNGTDLSGWKTVSVKPRPAKPGVLAKIPRLFEGKEKPKDVKWSVRNGAIQGEGGVGQLESIKSFENFILQVSGRALADAKKHAARASVFLRVTGDQLFSGYELPIAGDQSGSIRGLAEPRQAPSSSLVLETVVLSDRHFQIWTDGYPVTDFIDTRPEGTTIGKAAKIGPGAIALPEFDDSEGVEYLHFQGAALPSSLGSTADSKALAPALTSANSATSPAAANSAPSPAAVAPPVTSSGAAPSLEQDNRQRSALLMSQALRSNNPEEQMQLYDRVVRLDPSNSAAAQGYKEAQQQIQARQQSEKTWESGQIQRLQQEHSGDVERDGALKRAQEAFVKGDLSGAQRNLSIAQRIAPNSGPVLSLAQNLSAAQRVRSQFWILGGGGGLLALTGGLVYFLRRRGKKQACLHIISGDASGRKYDLNKDKIAIGSVVRDGEYRNDIVVTDSQRMVSRFHCEIHRREREYFVVDCKSANGTWLDHKLITPGQPQRLKRGSRIELGGQVTLQFELESLKKA